VNVARLKKIPFHIFLLPVFYILHATNEYYGLFPIRVPLQYLLYYLILSSLVFLCGWLLFRSITKAGFWSIIILILFFFFGKGIDILRASAYLQPLSTYKILLPVMAGILVMLTVYLRKTPRRFYKANSYFNILFCLLVLLEIIHSSVNFFSGADKQNDLSLHSPPLDIPILNTGVAAKPDIFFIVFDEYASSVSLKKYLNYDNSALDSSLAVHGFYVAKNSKGNYNATTLSLASTFNLQYFNTPLEHTPLDPKKILKGQYSFSKSLLPRIMEKQGYIIKNIGILDLENHPAPLTSYFQNSYRNIFYKETIWNRVMNDIWWNIGIKFPGRSERFYREKQTREVNSYTRNFENILAELQAQSNTPKFVYGHIFMPHRPYYLNRQGQFMNTLFNYTSYSRDSLYLEQLAFCNSWIDSLARAAGQPFSRPRVIIIEGDHGYRDANDNQHTRDRELMNLSAYYFSDKDYTSLYDSITPVNSFRLIFNKYFHANLPLLKDSTILLY
jgi:hypothetical protein